MKDEIQQLLIQALAFLEMGLNPGNKPEDQGHEEDLMWAAHEHVQRAWGLFAGHEDPHKISRDTKILVGTWHALNAIENAARKD